MTDSADHPRADLAPHGVVTAAINLGNPVLAQGDADDPRGVTVDIARQVATRLGARLHVIGFDAARKSFEALAEGAATLAFLAIDPARAQQVAFTEPYLSIDGVYAVPDPSPHRSPADVDAPGVRIGVKDGSAYDLFLSRTLEHATVVRGVEGTTVFAERELEVAAGIRQPLAAYTQARPGMRILDEPFMQIRQAVATRAVAHAETMIWLDELLDELSATGVLAGALRSSGQDESLVARRL